MDTTIDHVEKVLKKKETFTGQDMEAYLKSSKLHFWEFAVAAIPMDHLHDRARNRITLCKEINAHLKKKKNGKSS